MFEYIAARLLWKIDVENDNVGTRLVGIGVDLVEKVYCLLAVPHDVEVDTKVHPFDGSPDKIHIRLVVLDDEDLKAARRRPFVRWGW
jgi:hypothetical protein